jgi:hypothetical protein
MIGGERPALTGVVALVVLLALGVTGCVSPARTNDQYREKALVSIESAISEVETGALVVRQRLDERVFTTYADEVVTASETAAGAISDAFGSVQPPDPAGDELRDEVTALLSDAEDALGHARIAVRRSDVAGLRTALTELESVSSDLSAAEERLQ